MMRRTRSILWPTLLMFLVFSTQVHANDARCRHHLWDTSSTYDPAPATYVLFLVDQAVRAKRRGEPELVVSFAVQAGEVIAEHPTKTDAPFRATFLSDHFDLAGMPEAVEPFLSTIVDRNIPISILDAVYATPNLQEILRVNALRRDTNRMGAITTLERVAAEIAAMPLCPARRLHAEAFIAREYAEWADPARGAMMLDDLERRTESLERLDLNGIPIRWYALDWIMSAAYVSGDLDRVRRLRPRLEAAMKAVIDDPALDPNELDTVRDSTAYFRQQLSD